MTPRPCGPDRPQARASRRSGLGVLIVLLLTGLLPTTGATAQAAERAPSLQLVRQSTWIEPDGAATIAVRVADAPAGGRVEARIHDRLRSRTGFLAGIEPPLAGRSLAASTPVPLQPTGPSGAPVDVNLSIGLRSGSGPSDRVLLRNEGVYPVEVRVVDAGGEVRAALVTHLVRLPDELDQPPLDVAVVQLIRGAPGLQPDMSIQLDASTRTAITLSTSAFLSRPGIPVTTSVTPETLAALVEGAHPLDMERVEELSEIVRGGGVAASPYVSLDLDALLQAGLGDEIGDQLARGATAVSRILGVNVESGLWIADTDLTRRALNELAERGVTRMVVPHEILDDLDPELFDITLVQPFDLDAGDGRRVAALATDPVLQSWTQAGTDDVLAAQHLLSDLAMLYFDRPAYERAIPIVIDPGASSPTFLDAFLAGLDASPLLRPSGASDAIEGASPAARGGSDAAVATDEDRLVRSLRSESGGTELGDLPQRLSETRRRIESYASVFGGGDPAIAEFQARLAVTPASQLGRGGRDAYFDAVLGEIDHRLASIGLGPGRTMTLAARDGTLPLALTNDSGQPVRVVLRLESEKLELPEGERLELTLEGSTTNIEIPVRARASGAFPLQLRLESPDGAILLAEERYTVRSTAVSGLGLALSIAAVLFLVVWWVRTALRARSARMAAEPRG